jgi:hypothetical protein
MDLRGTLLVRVHLATKSHDTPDKDRQHSVTVRFLTDYVAIAQFADDLEQVLDGVRPEAVLRGTNL